jgi:acetyl esterase/lipase
MKQAVRTSYALIPDLPYTAGNDGVRLLDLYLPETGRLRPPWPLLVFFHGGGLENGSRKEGEINALKGLGERGIAVVSADYRLYPRAAFPDYVRDAAEAAAFALNHGKDKNLFGDIYIGGSSAGAYLAMLLCFDGRYLGEAGIDHRRIKGYVFDAGQPTVHFRVLKERGLDERRVRIDEAAPLYHLDEQFMARGHQPELLILTADNDMPCRYEQNLVLIKTLEHFGYDMSKVHFRLMRGYSHCGYVEAKDSAGAYIYGDMLEGFIRKN